MANTLEYLMKLNAGAFEGPMKSADAATKSFSSTCGDAGARMDAFLARIRASRSAIDQFQKGQINAAQAAKQMGVETENAGNALANAGRGAGALKTVENAVSAVVSVIGLARVQAERLSNTKMFSDQTLSEIRTASNLFDSAINKLDLWTGEAIAGWGIVANKISGGTLAAEANEAAVRKMGEAYKQAYAEFEKFKIDSALKTMTPEQRKSALGDRLADLHEKSGQAKEASTGNTPEAVAASMKVLAYAKEMILVRNQIAEAEKEIGKAIADSTKEAERFNETQEKRNEAMLEARKDWEASIKSMREEAAGNKEGAAKIRDDRKAEKEAAGMGISIPEMKKQFDERRRLQAQIDANNAPAPKEAAEKPEPQGRKKIHGYSAAQWAANPTFDHRSFSEYFKGGVKMPSPRNSDRFNDLFHPLVGPPRSAMKGGVPNPGIEAPAKTTRRQQEKAAAEAAAKAATPRWDLVEKISSKLTEMTAE